MRLFGYGIELKRITIEDTEMIRQWRNSEFVKKHMEYREEITPEMQLRWFHSIDTIQHNYCLIRYHNDYVGVIHGSDIDWNNGITHNGGIFMKQEAYTLTDIPLRASFLMTDLSFALGTKRTIIKVLNSNQRALFYNKSMGYQLIAQNELYSNFELTEENYLRSAEKLKALLLPEEEREIVLIIDRPEHEIEKNIINHFNANASTRWKLRLEINGK
jgi:RimJ/RimL family protein N-acetyltransferase